MRVCAVDECSKRVKARGWCAMHWSRWRRHGDLGTVAKPGPVPDLSVPLVDPDPEPPTECVDCQGEPMPGGVIRCERCLLEDLDRRAKARARPVRVRIDPARVAVKGRT